MRAALVREIGALPEAGDSPEPVAADGEVVVDVLAASLNPVDVNVAAGRFYGGHPELPFVPGAEAVGRVRDAGALAWVFGEGIGLRRNGCIAEQVAVPEAALVTFESELEPAVAAALGIAGMAGWLPLAWRTTVRRDDTVLVLAATGAAGRVAVQAARLLGARRVVAAGRDEAALERVRELGADATVRLDGADDLAERMREACGGAGADVVVDPLWGEPLVAALDACAPGARIIHVGQSAGATATLASSVVRGKQLDVLGLSVFAVPRSDLAQEYRLLLRHAAAGDMTVDVETFPLDRVLEAWERQAAGPDGKLAIVP